MSICGVFCIISTSFVFSSVVINRKLFDLIYETLTRIPRFVNGDEWYKFSIKLRNHGGDSHEFGVMPHLVGGDSRIQKTEIPTPYLKYVF